MTKYTKYYQQMWDLHKNILSTFQEVHDQYQKQPKEKKLKESFDTIGKQAREVMEDWDKRLCMQMEKGYNGVFSSKVSEKFWTEIKKDFPLVDLVGVEVSYV